MVRVFDDATNVAEAIFYTCIKWEGCGSKGCSVAGLANVGGPAGTEGNFQVVISYANCNHSYYRSPASYVNGDGSFGPNEAPGVICNWPADANTTPENPNCK
jgi:hypothetical protein